MNFIVINARKVLPWAALVMIIPIMCLWLGKSSAVYKVNGREIPIYSVERDDNKIALTFDCAWNDDDVDQILDTLDLYNCRATFFVVGDWAQKYPSSLQKIYQRGHEIGTHSYNHKDYTKLSRQELDEDMELCDSVVEEIIGIRPKLFRAPSGGYNDSVIEVCEARGNTYIQWSVDSIDYNDASQKEIYERVVPKTKAGDIILMHNGTANTANILPQILAELSKNYSFSTVSDMIYTDNYRIDHTGRQFAQ